MAEDNASANLGSSFTKEIVDMRPRPRYVPDFTVPQFHIPVPTQICFFIGDPYAVRDDTTLMLVKITKVDSTGSDEHYRHHRIHYTKFDVQDGHATKKRYISTVLTSNAVEHRYHHTLPLFVHAIDRWDTVPDPRPAYADVLEVFQHGFGLINAKYLDLKTEIANLNATLQRLVPSGTASSSSKSPNEMSE